MSRYIDSVCKLCRRESTKLFLKGTRCYTEKCALDRRAYPPGQHGQARNKLSEYGVQLREKQKAKRMYGLSESSFRIIFGRAERMRGVTGEKLLSLLDLRLDNLVYYFGFAVSRPQARQLVSHGHFLVNGRRVNIPSYSCVAGDVIQFVQKSKEMFVSGPSFQFMDKRPLPVWLEMNKEELKGTVKFLPRREDLTIPVQERLIVELYSK